MRNEYQKTEKETNGKDKKKIKEERCIRRGQSLFSRFKKSFLARTTDVNEADSPNTRSGYKLESCRFGSGDVVMIFEKHISFDRDDSSVRCG